MLIEIEAVKDTWRADPAPLRCVGGRPIDLKPVDDGQHSSAHTGNKRRTDDSSARAGRAFARIENAWYKVAGQLSSAAISRIAMAGPQCPTANRTLSVDSAQ
jgi:hypothetical protein